MDAQMQILKRKLKDQQQLRNVFGEALAKSIRELASKFEEQKVVKIQLFETETSIAADEAEVAAYKELNDKLLAEIKDQANDDKNEERVGQEVLDFLNGKETFPQIDLFLIAEYQNLQQHVKDTKTSKQIQEEIEEVNLEKDRYVAKAIELQMIVEETRRRIIENDFPAFRKAAELKKQKMSLQQQRDDMAKVQRDNQVQLKISESKRDALKKELKKKQELKALEGNVFNYSSMLKNFPETT